MGALERGLRTRILIIAGILLVAFFLLHAATREEQASLRRPLREFPLALGAWRGVDQPFEQRILDALGVDDYLNRAYVNGGGQAELYVGYYRSQRTGKLVHSPKNCLPGAGWEPVRSGSLSVLIPGRAPITVNEYVIAKGSDRRLVLYWYHGRGRVVASEYWAKWYMMTDAISRNRTDGALVRVVVSAKGGEEQARAQAVELLRGAYPLLQEYIPE
jgi:EpsI family protein